MKCLLVLLSFAAVAWSQEESECNCEVVLKLPTNEIISVDDLPVNAVIDCEDHSGCMKTCRDEWNSLTNGGDMHFVQENGEILGQNLCDIVAAQGIINLEAQKLHMVYSLCHSEWQEEGIASQDYLCCVDGDYPGEC